jgi:hypothetical protein
MNNASIKLSAAVSILLLNILCGCNESSSQQAEKATEKPIPKQRFHLPKAYPKGVERIRELFDSVSGDGELPEPITYQVLEIMHGTGAAAHSHYHLLKGSGDQEFEDDGHETVGEKTHTVVVDWSSELTDLARWLPKIAVGGDMDEQTWIKVQDLSASLSGELESAFKGAGNAAAKREAVRQRAESIAGTIEQLEYLVPGPVAPPTAE